MARLLGRALEGELKLLKLKLLSLTYGGYKNYIE